MEYREVEKHVKKMAGLVHLESLNELLFRVRVFHLSRHERPAQCRSGDANVSQGSVYMRGHALGRTSARKACTHMRHDLRSTSFVEVPRGAGHARHQPDDPPPARKAAGSTRSPGSR